MHAYTKKSIHFEFSAHTHTHTHIHTHARRRKNMRPEKVSRKEEVEGHMVLLLKLPPTHREGTLVSCQSHNYIPAILAPARWRLDREERSHSREIIIRDI